MNGHSYLKILEFLQSTDVQAQIQRSIQQGRSGAAVPISHAAITFGFTENQLRDWETRGLLKPIRREEKGRRLYPVAELDKLAIIRELMKVGFAPGDIPPDIDRMWYEALPVEDRQHVILPEAQEDVYRYIIRRIETIYHRHLVWRCYASRALLFSIMSLYEDAPNAYLGLILPFENDISVRDVQSLPRVGKSLVGWLGQTRTFYTFFTPEPTFETPSSYQLQAVDMGEMPGVVEGGRDAVLITVPGGKVGQLNLQPENVRLVHRLLEPLFEVRRDWEHYFGYGMQDVILPGMDTASKLPDALLNGIADMVVRLGGKTAEGEDRWVLSYIALPEDNYLPMLQRKLIVRATSERCRDLDGFKIAHYHHSLCLRAFLGKRVVSRAGLSQDDVSIKNNPVEQGLGVVRSNIAVPVGGEIDVPLGVLYVASRSASAFNDEDRRILRLMARIVEEILQTYQERQKLTMNFLSLMREPSVVDTAFREFPSEDDFVEEVQRILREIQEESQLMPVREYAAPGKEPAITCIAIDIDEQDALAARYGDRTLRRLSLAVGLRIRQLLQALIINYRSYNL
ncbi:MAG: MerR family transcriptional regulator, partial [Ktedonobacteraceae bacterium]|nr:MerR family transcriptional regulator [Ktedonobacteraceae bacterium]